MTIALKNLTIFSVVMLYCSSGAIAEKISVNNNAISVTVETDDGTISVTDKRTGQTWRQKALVKGNVTDASQTADNIEMSWRQPGPELDVRVKLRLDKDKPEFTVELSAEGALKSALSFPHPFVTKPGTYLVVPMNEGISYPVDDETIKPRWLAAYGGHGICMSFWGVTDGRRGHMAIIETPDDAAIYIKRADGTLCIEPKWESQKGNFGYTRKLRYIFFENGGHVAICKRYRRYAQQAGKFKTLEEKRRENPNVDLLIGAVNIWCWEQDALAIVRQARSLGIKRILWSNRKPPEVIKAMNEMDGVLTSRYDIYQDLMDPQIVKDKLRGQHPDWTQEGWCGVLCDKQALKYAEQRVPEELKTHPYRCRFIDTTTASPWRECFHPEHPMTRSDSRHWKMELLRYMSEEMKLVTGSETGHDAAVPYVHYFEGMLSLGPYRVSDAGRNMRKIWDEVPERVAKFQLGHKYRLPLWELVYHDCVVAQWYWGDYNNKLPALWQKRDLFNILYGTAPMFMFDRKLWEQEKEHFARSYKNICEVTRAVGYAEMTDHRFLTSDRDVQQTKFANGVIVTVNFGDKPYRLPEGNQIEPMGYYVTGM